MVVLSESGGNGGGGSVAARHLANRGVMSRSFSTRSDKLTLLPADQLDILTRMGMETAEVPVIADVVLDALLGYGLQGASRERIGEPIEATVPRVDPHLPLASRRLLDPRTVLRTHR